MELATSQGMVAPTQTEKGAGPFSTKNFPHKEGFATKMNSSKTTIGINGFTMVFGQINH